RARNALVLERGQLLLAAGAQHGGRRLLGRERGQLRGDRPRPGVLATGASAGALDVAQAGELLAARIAHPRRGVIGVGCGAAPELERLARTRERDPGAGT